MAQARVPNRLIEICATVADADSRALRARLLDALRPYVPFDAHVWVLTDPETSVGTAPLAQVPVPLFAQLPDLVRAKYLSTVNRWTTLGESVATLDGRPMELDTDPGDSWTHLLHMHGITDVASMAFSDRQGCWGFLDLWRAHGAPPFSVAECELLEEARAPVTRALRQSQAAAFVPGLVPAPYLGPVVALLSPELLMLGQTPAAPALLGALLPTQNTEQVIPAAALNVAAQLLAVEAGIDASPPEARVHLAGSLWLKSRAAWITDGRPGGDRTIAVTIEPATASDRARLFARAHALTDRERELLVRLCGGGDTRRVASDMSLSTHTVQDHLKSIFAETGVSSRRELLARALGG
ncbi:MAG: LuxR C-terminal-related transcriptional regulator [Thermoleophilia bacterium]